MVDTEAAAALIKQSLHAAGARMEYSGIFPLAARLQSLTQYGRPAAIAALVVILTKAGAACLSLCGIATWSYGVVAWLVVHCNTSFVEHEAGSPPPCERVHAI